MNLENIKLVITDMDGTLLNSKHQVSSKFLKQYKQLQSHNILFVAASGRPYYSIIEKLDSIKNDIIVVAENGGIIVDNTKVLASKSIDKSKIKTIDNIINELEGIITIYCTKDLAYIKETTQENINIVKEYYSNYQLINSISEIKDKVVKIALYHPKSSEICIYPFVKRFNDKNKVIISSPNWIDISEKGINKGNALNLLQQKYNVKESEILAFGDYNNDIEMLKKAKFSVAMKNAHEDVKSISKFETTSNDDLGVERILDILLEQKINSQKQ